MLMILLHKYEPQIALDEIHHKAFRQHEDLVKIIDFIELPDSIKLIEKQNSSILRNYYANALSHNLVEVKTVKYVLNGNIRAKGLSERAIDCYNKAEQWLESQINEPLTIGMVYHLQQLLIIELYNNHQDVNLFNAQKIRVPEKLSYESEQDLEALFEYLHSDTDAHPVVQSWVLHFRLLNIPLFSEASNKIACLLQHFWLRKKGMDLSGLMSLEHELYINKNDYQTFFGEEASNDLDRQIHFGMQMYAAQLQRLKLLMRNYFRKQIDFEKHNARLKNIMNYVFERGFRLKELDETILNKRQRLMIYIIQHKGFIATKELSDEFECNRKTIQRDFNALVDLNLVKVVGQGAGLKYAVNIQEHKHEYLKSYQADFLHEEEQLA